MNKGIFFLLVLTVFSVFYVRPWTTTENVEVIETPKMMCNPDFNINYEIDLKQEGYVLVDEEGNCHWVEFNELEDYLLNLNL